jgi:sulfonate transport system substrate-binding protein
LLLTKHHQQSSANMLPIHIARFIERFVFRRTRALQLAAVASMLSVSFACA